MFGREVIEGQEHITIFLETLTGRWILRLVPFQEGVEGPLSILARFGHPDLVDVALRPGLHALEICQQVVFQGSESGGGFGLFDSVDE